MQTQASPFHLSRGVIRSITLFFGWDICSSLSSSSFGVLTACSAESLVQASLPSLAQGHPESFHCHRVPDAFQLPLCWFRGSSSSRTIGLGQSSIGICSISGVFSGRIGMGRFFWALQDPARNQPPWVVWNHMGFPLCIPVFCRVRFVLAVLHVDDGSYWSTMVSDGLDLILQCWSAGTNCARVSGRGLLRQERVRRAPLRWTISILSSAAFLAWSSRKSWSAWDVEWFGLPRSRHLSETLCS